MHSSSGVLRSRHARARSSIVPLFGAPWRAVVASLAVLALAGGCAAARQTHAPIAELRPPIGAAAAAVQLTDERSSAQPVTGMLLATDPPQPFGATLPQDFPAQLEAQARRHLSGQGPILVLHATVQTAEVHPLPEDSRGRRWEIEVVLLIEASDEAGRSWVKGRGASQFRMPLESPANDVQAALLATAVNAAERFLVAPETSAALANFGK